MSTPKPMTFEEWVEANPELVAQACSTCKGKGTITHDCDCEHCTRADEGDEDDCPECNGGGDIALPTLRERYDLALKADRDRLERWHQAVAP